MSPFRSSAGPATVRIPTPSSSRTIVASVVLPSPGGPTSSTWSSASPRAFAASSAISSCSLIRSWPTKSSSRRGRSECSTSSSPVAQGRCEELAASRGAPQRLAHALLGGQLRDRRRRAPAPPRRPSSRARRERRARRDRAALRSPTRPGRSRPAIELLQLEHDPLGGLLADPGDRLEARRVAERDRAPQLVAATRWRRRRARPSGRCRSPRGAGRRARARRRRRTRRAGARPRGRGGTSRPSALGAPSARRSAARRRR